MLTILTTIPVLQRQEIEDSGILGVSRSMGSSRAATSGSECGDRLRGVINDQ